MAATMAPLTPQHKIEVKVKGIYYYTILVVGDVVSVAVGVVAGVVVVVAVVGVVAVLAVQLSKTTSKSVIVVI